MPIIKVRRDIETNAGLKKAMEDAAETVKDGEAIPEPQPISPEKLKELKRKARQ